SFLLLPRPLAPTLFPYTTLFRSVELDEPLPRDAHKERVAVLDEPQRTKELPAFGARGDLFGDLAVGLEEASALHVGHEIQSVAKDRKSTRLNSSHVKISYAVFCL